MDLYTITRCVIVTNDIRRGSVVFLCSSHVRVSIENSFHSSIDTLAITLSRAQAIRTVKLTGTRAHI